MITETKTDKKAQDNNKKNMFDKPRLILTHGEKGGVGKTTVARVIADFLNSQDISYRAFDAEGPTGQMLRFHPKETSPVDVSNAASISPVLDYVMDGQGKKIALVDLGARSGTDVKAWLYRGGALEEAEAGRLGITVVYVLGGAVDSVGHLKECYEALGKEVAYVIVKNYGVAHRFDVYDESHVRGDLIGLGTREVAFPALDGSVFQSVDKASVSFSSFVENVGGTFGYTERRYCRTWLRECYSALEEVAAVLH